MKILITNDDGYKAAGIKTLAKILRPFGELTIVSPKYPQSGMSMAVNLGFKPMAVKKISEAPGERWFYMDATPSSCVKFGLDNIFVNERPDVVVSGINHGINAGNCSPYSGTIGAVKEAALARVPGIAVSLDSHKADADMSCIEKLFPAIFEDILANKETRYGVFYNVNFPNLPAESIKGVRVSRLGRMHWENEFQPFDPDIYDKLGVKPIDLGIKCIPQPEPGEEIYAMMGDMTDEHDTHLESDHLMVREGYISITPENLDDTDVAEFKRLKSIDFDKDFK